MGRVFCAGTECGRCQGNEGKSNTLSGRIGKVVASLAEVARSLPS